MFGPVSGPEACRNHFSSHIFINHPAASQWPNNRQKFIYIFHFSHLQRQPAELPIISSVGLMLIPQGVAEQDGLEKRKIPTCV